MTAICTALRKPLEMMRKRSEDKTIFVPNPKNAKAPLSRGFCVNLGGKPGIRTLETLLTSAGFQDCRLNYINQQLRLPIVSAPEHFWMTYKPRRSRGVHQVAETISSLPRRSVNRKQTSQITPAATLFALPEERRCPTQICSLSYSPSSTKPSLPFKRASWSYRTGWSSVAQQMSPKLSGPRCTPTTITKSS